MPTAEPLKPKRTVEAILLDLFDHLHMLTGRHPTGTALLAELADASAPEAAAPTEPATEAK